MGTHRTHAAHISRQLRSAGYLLVSGDNRRQGISVLNGSFGNVTVRMSYDFRAPGLAEDAESVAEVLRERGHLATVRAVGDDECSAFIDVTYRARGEQGARHA